MMKTTCLALEIVALATSAWAANGEVNPAQCRCPCPMTSALGLRFLRTL